MINKLIAFTGKNPFVVLLIMLAIMGAGLWAIDRTPIDAIPDLSDVQVIITTEWEGPSPTLNVPRGFDMLVDRLERDAGLRAAFFAELDVLFYAGASLAPSTWERLERLGGGRVMMASAWGATETAPLVTAVHFPIPRAGVVGLPAPGCLLKLMPTREGKLEMRVRGPNVTPGTWLRGGRVAPAPVDEDGFLATGDAARFEDEREPARGIVFDGRTAENFKLSSGTWVSVGNLRVRAIAACAPAVADAVVAGHDRGEILVFAAPGAEDVRRRVREGLAAHNAAHPGSSTRVARAIVASEPPSIDGGEITDKGYLNQRRILERRADLVARLYAEPPDDGVIVP